MARVERRFFETVVVGILREIMDEIEPAPRSRENTTRLKPGGSSESEARSG
ncbi:hypothetical protein RAD15_22095 [Bradyrhizobium sp. 14AA]